MNMPINELDLQRCADGEISPTDRRALLDRLDSTPDGWKSLALAFLDNQSFDTGSAEFRLGPPVTPLVTTSRLSSSARPPRTAAIRWATLAASVGFAFWLGTRTGSDSVDVRGSATPPGAIASARPQPTPTFAAGEPDAAMPLASNSDPHVGPQPTAVLKLPFSGSDEDALAIPVYDQSRLASDNPEFDMWSTFDTPPALSEPGYRVTSEKNVVSIPLASGDTVFVPVEVRNVSYAVQ